jgi:hypothetical protein
MVDISVLDLSPIFLSALLYLTLPGLECRVCLIITYTLRKDAPYPLSTKWVRQPSQNVFIS